MAQAVIRISRRINTTRQNKSGNIVLHDTIQYQLRTGKRHADRFPDLSHPPTIKYREQAVNLNAPLFILPTARERGLQIPPSLPFGSVPPFQFTDKVQKSLVIGIVEIFFHRRLPRDTDQQCRRHPYRLVPTLGPPPPPPPPPCKGARFSPLNSRKIQYGVSIGEIRYFLYRDCESVMKQVLARIYTFI